MAHRSLFCPQPTPIAEVIDDLVPEIREPLLDGKEQPLPLLNKGEL